MLLPVAEDYYANGVGDVLTCDHKMHLHCAADFLRIGNRPLQCPQCKRPMNEADMSQSLGVYAADVEREQERLRRAQLEHQQVQDAIVARNLAERNMSEAQRAQRTQEQTALEDALMEGALTLEQPPDEHICDLISEFVPKGCRPPFRRAGVRLGSRRRP